MARRTWLSCALLVVFVRLTVAFPSLFTSISQLSNCTAHPEKRFGSHSAPSGNATRYHQFNQVYNFTESDRLNSSMLSATTTDMTVLFANSDLTGLVQQQQLVHNCRHR